MAESYSKSLVAFSGADMIVSFDGELIGEIQSVKWQREIEQRMDLCPDNSVTGEIVVCCMGRDALSSFEGKKSNVLIRFLDEYGNSKLEFLKDVQLKTKSSSISVDDFIQLVTYSFKAKDVVVLHPTITNPEEQLKFVFDNEHSYDRGTQLEALAYKELLKTQISRGYYRVIDGGEYARLKTASEKKVEPEIFDAKDFATKVLKALEDKKAGF